MITKRQRVLAAKIETTQGTAVSLAGADGAFNVYDVTIDADIPMTERKGQGSMSKLASVPGTRAGSLKFKLDVYGSGSANTSPTWATTFLPACGMVETAGTWALASDQSVMKT